MIGDTLRGIHWLGHASFRIDDPKGCIYIDPWKVRSGAPPADLLLITHPHDDHFSPRDIARLRTDRTIICCPPDVARALEGPVTVVHAGAPVTVGAWDVEVLPAGNPSKRFHPLANRWVGYVVTLTDGRKVLHTGDTDALPAHGALRVDVALLPCGGTYTMDGEEAGRLAEEMAPRVAVPMHWGDIVGSRADAESVRRHYPPTVILDPER